MRDFRQLSQSRFFVDELLAIQITEFLAVKPDAKICSKNSFPVLLVDASERIMQFAIHMIKTLDMNSKSAKKQFQRIPMSIWCSCMIHIQELQGTSAWNLGMRLILVNIVQ